MAIDRKMAEDQEGNVNKLTTRSAAMIAEWTRLLLILT
jgi:hypothetical protein